MPETKVPPSGTSYPPSLLVSKLKSDVTEEEIRKVFGGTGVISKLVARGVFDLLLCLG